MTYVRQKILILLVTIIAAGCHPHPHESWETIGVYSGNLEVHKRITRILANSGFECRDGDGSIYHPVRVPAEVAPQAKQLLLEDSAQNGYWFKTSESFQEMMRIGKLSSEAFAKAETKAREKDFHAAIALYCQAISVAPEYCDAYVGRARAYRQVGRNARAMEDYDRAIEILRCADFHYQDLEEERRELTHQ